MMTHIASLDLYDGNSRPNCSADSVASESVSSYVFMENSECFDEDETKSFEDGGAFNVNESSLVCVGGGWKKGVLFPHL